MSTEPDPRQLIIYEGRKIPYGAAERYVLLLEHAAVTALYVSTPEHWPGYIAWLEQIDPTLPCPAGSEEAREGCAIDGQHLCDMAYVAREKLERAAGNGER